MILSLSKRLQGAGSALIYCMVAGFLLTVVGLVIPVFSQVFVDDILVQGRQLWLNPLLGGMAIAAILQGSLTLLRLRYLRRLKIKLGVGMSSRFLWHILRLPVSFYAQRFAGEISNRTTLNDQVADVLAGKLATTIIDTFMVVFYALVMVQYDWVLTLMVVSFAAVNVFTLQWISRQRVDANQRLIQEYGKAAGLSIAALQSIETLKASGLESDFFSRWSGYYTKALNSQQELGVTNQTFSVLPTLLSALAAMLLLVVGGLRVMDGHLSIGMLIAFQGLMLGFQQPVNNLVNFGTTLQELEGNLIRLDDVLNNPIGEGVGSGEWGVEEADFSGYLENLSLNLSPTRRETLNFPPSRVGKLARGLGQSLAFPDDLNCHVEEEGSREAGRVNSPSSPNLFPKLQGYVELRNISFGYSRLEAPLIENFNLSIKPGQRVALVGGSGSGKSTIAKLVSGLYECWAGEVCFDGKPREQIHQQMLTNSVAMVEQEILLFGGTVRDNLTLWDTTVPDKNLMRACQDAAIADVILSMSGGFDAELIEGAANLSGGQRQRLEIARALVNNPSILVMDEATSALDAETEQIIDQNLRRRGCTCIIVAHRLSTIRDCDQIIVLERGKVVQQGTHKELWQVDGVYSRLIRTQGEADEG
jgi:ATP-binding cassette subfamily C protein